VCAACGRPAMDRVSLRFSWHPRWAEPLFVFAWAFTRRISVRLPGCRTHAWRWRWRNVVLLIIFTPVIGLIAGAYAYYFGQPPGVADGGVVAGLACSGGVVLLLCAVIAEFSFPSIPVRQITDRHLTLEGVHEAFIAALADDRARSTDPLRAQGYGDVRDDYDDRAPDPD